MCEGNKPINSKNRCNCDLKFEMGAISEAEMLMQLREYKRNLESELLIVKNKLKQLPTGRQY